MLTRRKIATGSLGLLSLSVVGCTTSNTGTQTVSVPSLAQVQEWVNILATEIPLFVQESISANIITGTVVTKVQSLVKTFETLATQFTSATFNVTNASQVASEIGAALTTIASVIPAAVPYLGFIQLGIAVITGFIAATPMIVPAVPAKASLAKMHLDTIKFKLKK